METLVVANHRNHHQCYGGNPGHGPARFDSFGSVSSGNLRAVNCRTFQSGTGLLPTPLQSPLKSLSSPVTKNASFSPKTPSQHKSSTAPIPIKVSFEEGKFHFSERWAGPAYSNSPPPSSLPLPKFFLGPKRTVSLELPSLDSETDMHPISKSAPASPTRWSSPPPSDLFDSADSATKTLRRILNLDISNDD